MCLVAQWLGYPPVMRVTGVRSLAWELILFPMFLSFDIEFWKYLRYHLASAFQLWSCITLNFGFIICINSAELFMPQFLKARENSKGF